MRKVLISAALAAALATPALATTAPSAEDAAKNAAAREGAAPAKARMLYVCDTSDLTRRSFERAHGSMEFVTAEAVARDKEAWANPRCISRVEFQKLQQTVASSGR
ncbi:MAG: hypothetical protein ACK4YQ_09550 [Phenylobacterium sp.]|uniref:hypothetical protein n=1 Tax=Phenylobacterium sp. TaxID=1871053 RepID=UPI00391D256A